MYTSGWCRATPVVSRRRAARARLMQQLITRQISPTPRKQRHPWIPGVPKLTLRTLRASRKAHLACSQNLAAPVCAAPDVRALSGERWVRSRPGDAPRARQLHFNIFVVALRSRIQPPLHLISTHAHALSSLNPRSHRRHRLHGRLALPHPPRPVYRYRRQRAQPRSTRAPPLAARRCPPAAAGSCRR